MLAPSGEQLHASVLLFLPKAVGIKVETRPQGKAYFFFCSCVIKMSASTAVSVRMASAIDYSYPQFFFLPGPLGVFRAA